MGTIIIVFVAGLLLFLGVMIKYFKAYDLIAGYNTASPEVRRYAEEKGLGNFVGSWIITLGLIILAGGVAGRLGYVWVELASWGVFTAALVYIVVRAQEFTPPGSRISPKIILAVSLVVVSLVVIPLVLSSLPPSITLEEQKIIISGAYGLEVPVNEVNSVELRDEIPAIKSKSNGLNVGPILKGDFMLQDLGRARLFIGSQTGPFIFIRTGQRPIIINYSSPEKTVETYSMLKYQVERNPSS